ncbi:MAG: electron transfer flavoprotein subunit alpha/FixB family protein [Pseudomonadota bacterium]
MGANILVWVESKEGKIKKASLELLSEAGRLAAPLQGKVKAFLIGAGVAAGTAELGKYGVTDVYLADDPEFKLYNVERYALALTEAVGKSQAAVLLATASAAGKDLLPRIAARLNTGMVTECTALRAENGTVVAQRPIYAGKVLIDARVPSAHPAIITCRPNVFEVTPAKSATTPSVTPVGQEAAKLAVRAKIVEVVEAKSGRPDLTEASVIVSAGRAIKSAENFAMMNELADVLGAAVGATRAAVDAGYAPHSIQVGQTGKTVNPKLYIAFGISGAIQHLAGMQTSKVIVAVNTDPEAPIFQKADYGIVGDLFEVVPKMTEALKKLLSE